MPCILPKFPSLIQYINALNFVPPVRVRPDCCIYCGRMSPWWHGCHPRKPDREHNTGGSLNPILIQRCYCPGCKKTFSVLPECVPPRRWYLWEVQQAVLLLFILGQSAYAIAKKSTPSYKTIKRWIARFQEQFLLHKDTLCARFAELGQTSGVSEFWQACLKKMTLGSAMRICHVAEVIVP